MPGNPAAPRPIPLEPATLRWSPPGSAVNRQSPLGTAGVRGNPLALSPAYFNPLRLLPARLLGHTRRQATENYTGTLPQTQAPIKRQSAASGAAALARSSSCSTRQRILPLADFGRLSAKVMMRGTL